MQRILAVLIAFGVVLGSVGWAAPVSATHLSTLLAEDGVGPVTDGEWIVWANDSQGSTRQLLATRTGSHESTIVSEEPVWIWGYDLDRGLAVWSGAADGCQNLIGETCNQNVYARDLQSGRIIEVAATGDVEEWPVISGTRVVWNVWDGESWHVRSRDIATMSEPVTIFSENQSQVEMKYRFPVLSGSSLAWVTYWDDGSPEASPDWRIWVQNIDTDGPPLLVDEGSGMIDDLDLAVDTLVYVGGSEGLVAVDLATMETTPIHEYGTDLTTDGHYVIWREGHQPDNDASNGTDLWAHDLLADATFTVAFGNRYNLAPHLSGGWLVWENGGLPFPDDQFKHDIHAAPWDDLLPSGRRPPAEITIPEIIYHPETGHYLGGGFRLFWDGNGGLQVFGHPMTEEYSERNLDTGLLQTTQFFERQRFEWHPENAGTPYIVLLGRLGYEDAAANGLLHSKPFQPIPADTGETDCRWFAETRQTTCTDFLAYWHSHGLDFGDPGTSYRESLALFGYPISQPYIDPDTGLLTQYFERAIFELHPTNPDPYRVLLRRLGAEALATRDW